MVGGDFNEILHRNEKIGGNERELEQMKLFENALNFCWLSDLGVKGYRYTWSNKRLYETFTEVRLDRFVACNGWIARNPGENVINLTVSKFDHAPIMLGI